MIKNGLKIANINASEILKIQEGRYGEIKYNCVRLAHNNKIHKGGYYNV